MCGLILVTYVWVYNMNKLCGGLISGCIIKPAQTNIVELKCIKNFLYSFLLHLIKVLAFMDLLKKQGQFTILHTVNWLSFFNEHQIELSIVLDCDF